METAKTMAERHAAEVAALAEKHQVAARFLSTVPAEVGERVTAVHHGKAYRFPWICFRAESVADALDIIAQCGTLHPVDVWRSGCTSVQPVGYHPAQYATGGAPQHAAVASCVTLKQHVGERFASADLCAWTVSGFYVNVSIGPGSSTVLPHKLRDTCYREQGSFGREGRLVKRIAPIAGAAWIISYAGDSVHTKRAFAGVDAARVALQA